MAIDNTRHIAERYNQDAVAYRDDWAQVLRKAGIVLLREMADQPAKRVLDVGTGVGTLLPDISEAFPGASVIGVDRSVGMLGLAPGETDRAVMDARQLAIRDESIDRVLMVFVLFHLEDPATGLREARRVLRGQGRVGVLTWGAQPESRAIKIWEECLEAYGAVKRDPIAQGSHAPVDSPAKMEKLLGDAGFAAARCWMGDLVYDPDTEQLIRLKTGLGASRIRFESMTSEARGECVNEARRRMQALSAEERVARGKVVYAIGYV